MPSETDAILRVDLPALVESLHHVAKICKPLRGEEAILSYDEACLHIDLGGMTITVPATGDWPGQCRVLGKFIVTIAKIPPTIDPVEFVVRDGLLHIGTSSFRCAWQTAWSAQLDLPVNASMIDLLALRHRHTNDEIMQSGLSVAVKDAEVKRDRLITKAVKHLGAMSVTEHDIRLMIDEKIKSVPE
jgi:hypothetical protein